MSVKFFTSEKISDRVTRIFGITGEIMYLVEGDEKAVLIDTGVGVGRLDEYVKTLTDKPITVLLTHGHIDHAMGAPLFADVRISDEDAAIYSDPNAAADRNSYVKALLSFMYPDEDVFSTLTEDDFIVSDFAKDDELGRVEDGDIFDLGNLHVQANACAGHTPGSMTFLIAEERMLVIGDAANSNTLLNFDYCPSIEEYRNNLIWLKMAVDGFYDRVLVSHGSGDIKNDLIESLIELCGEIIEGKDDKIEIDVMGKKAYLAKNRDEKYERLDGKTGDIVYSCDNIHAH